MYSTMSLFTCDRVLVPIDFSEVSWKSLEETLNFVPDSSHIYVLHVLSRLLPVEPGVIWQTVNDQTRMQSVVNLFEQRYPKSNHKNLHFEVKIGDPSAEIIDYAKNNPIDLIVIASHGYTGVTRFLLGSVTERVVRFAQCPVLVWR